MRRVYFPLILLIIFSFMLQGCASSAISRDAAKQIDVGYRNANSLIDSAANGSISDTYQNTNQSVKGVILGGAAGAAIGGATNGIGLLPGLAVGATLGGAFGAYLDGYTSTKDKLENRGVKVIVLGDQILIVMRSAHLFEGQTAIIRQGAYSTLYLVSKFISTYPNMLVKVSAYTSAMMPQKVNLALTQLQADSVAKYLWKTGINTRLLYAQGYGGCKLVTKNSFEDTNDNFRVEITLEKLPV